MVKTENVVVFCIYCIACGVCLSLFHVIASYHENKPLGMQSFLSKVIIMFLRSGQATAVYCCLVFGFCGLYGPLSYVSSCIVAVTEYVIVIWFYSTILLMTLTKYCSIYHSTFIGDLNEVTVIKYLKVTILIYTTFLTWIEFTHWTRFEELGPFQLVYNPGKIGLPTRIGYGEYVFALVNLIAAIALLSRMEYDLHNQQETEDIGCLSKLKRWFVSGNAILLSSMDNQEEYTVHIARFTVLVTVILFLTILAQVLFQILSFRSMTLVFFVLMGNLCPLVFILSHARIRLYFVRCCHLNKT